MNPGSGAGGLVAASGRFRKKATCPSTAVLLSATGVPAQGIRRLDSTDTLPVANGSTQPMSATVPTVARVSTADPAEVLRIPQPPPI
jgi:hypothetical protein